MSDDIRTKPVNQSYRDGWERTFGRRTCPDCYGGRLMIQEKDDSPENLWGAKWRYKECETCEGTGSISQHEYAARRLGE
jgi:hypothetical protein